MAATDSDTQPSGSPSTVTDDARTEAHERYADLDGVHQSITASHRDAFVAGAKWAAGRAETTTEATERIARQIAATTAMTGTDARECVEAIQALQHAETTAATVEDAARVITAMGGPWAERTPLSVAQALADAGLLRQP